MSSLLLLHVFDMTHKTPHLEHCLGARGNYHVARLFHFIYPMTHLVATSVLLLLLLLLMMILFPKQSKFNNNNDKQEQQTVLYGNKNESSKSEFFEPLKDSHKLQRAL